MNFKRMFLEVVILFGVGILILNGVILFQNNTIQKQRVQIKELYNGHPCGGMQ